MASTQLSRLVLATTIVCSFNLNRNNPTNQLRPLIPHERKTHWTNETHLYEQEAQNCSSTVVPYPAPSTLACYNRAKPPKKKKISTPLRSQQQKLGLGFTTHPPVWPPRRDRGEGGGDGAADAGGEAGGGDAAGVGGGGGGEADGDGGAAGGGGGAGDAAAAARRCGRGRRGRGGRGDRRGGAARGPWLTTTHTAALRVASSSSQPFERTRNGRRTTRDRRRDAMREATKLPLGSLTGGPRICGSQLSVGVYRNSANKAGKVGESLVVVGLRRSDGEGRPPSFWVARCSARVSRWALGLLG